jgi:hypothetical protein
MWLKCKICDSKTMPFKFPKRQPNCRQRTEGIARSRNWANVSSPFELRHLTTVRYKNTKLLIELQSSCAFSGILRSGAPVHYKNSPEACHHCDLILLRSF